MDPKSIKHIQTLHRRILKSVAARTQINKPSGSYDGNKVVSWSECAWRPKP